MYYNSHYSTRSDGCAPKPERATSQPPIQRRNSLKTYLNIAVIAACATGSIFSSPSYAVPASPEEMTLAQSNGMSFQARQWGDEFLNGFETTQGYTIVYDEFNTQWTYAMPDPDGYLVPSPLVVGVDAAPAWLPQQVRPEGMALAQAVQTSNAMLSGTQQPQFVQTTGTLNVPVILVNFKDRTPSYTKQDFQNLLFGTGNKSMRDYYQEVSYGKLNISSGPAGVVGWYIASQNHDYYGYNQGFGAAQGLVKEAVQAADATVNFANYDSDNDCVVDGLMVVHQGAGTESSGNYDDIWSHKWSISYTTNDTAACGSIRVNTYSIQPEKLGSGISTMGVYAHEFGHVLGLPDLYDTDYTSEGVGNWDLMSGGSWNGVARAGDTPAHLSAWSKIKLGWVTPTQVTSLLPNEPIEQAATKADVYRFVAGTEYYLVENRNRTGFDIGLPGSGLAIWHVDDAKGSNTAECVPPTNCAMNHYKVALVQADNQYQLEKKQNRGDAGDLFPGSTGKTVFNDTSTPSANLYSGTASLVTVKDISGSGTTMTATLCYGNQGILTPSPTSLDFGEISVGSSKTLVLTVSNTGCANLSIGTLTGSTMFKVQGTSCSTTLAVGANCTITFEFVPTTVGTITNTFTFTNGVSIPLKGIGKATTQPLTVSKNGTGLGTVTSNPTGINCGSDCTETYNAGTSVTLTATASAGSQFAGWTGACTGTGNCTVTMDAVKAVTATFNLIPTYTLSVGKIGAGANAVITSSPTGINCGATCSASYEVNTAVTLTATPNAGVVLTNWSGCASVNGNTCSVTMTTAKSVSATFATSPDIFPSPASLNFGTVRVGVMYGNEYYNPGAYIVIYNKGGANLIIGTTSITGTNASEFKEVNYSCSGKTIAPGSYCYEYIRIVASSAGNKTATLVVPSNDPDTANLNIPLTATAQEELTAANTDAACALTPTIQTVAPMGNWAVYNANTNQYDLPSHMWNPDRVPTKDDVVLINPGHMVVGIPYAQVKALCNKGTLKSKRDSSLQIYAYANGISNYGTIMGNVDQHALTKDQGTCANKAGNSVILTTPYAPIYNKGTIQAGPGGKEGGVGVGCAGHAGQALVYGRNVLNEGTIRSGKGGDITSNGTGGNGGLTYVYGEYGGGGSIVNKGTIISGDGGIGCPSGQGGDLYLQAHPQYLNGTFQSGKAGEILRNGCSKNRNGVIWIDPSAIEFGPDTKIEGGDIVIVGGDGWMLNFGEGTQILATGNITLQTGKGGEVNLANKPLIQAAGEITVLADHITTPEGIQISDVVKATNVTTGAGKIRYAVMVTGPGKTIGAPNSTVRVPLTIINSGPTKDSYTLTVENAAGWEISTLPNSVELEGLEATDLSLDVKLPANVGNTGVITVKVVSQSDTTVSAVADVAIEITTKMSPGNDPETGDGNDDIVPPPPIAYNASGTIRDQFDNVVSGVTLTAISKTDSTKIVTGMTDDTGYWQVTGLLAGEYTLTAEKAGYTFTSQDFSVNDGNNAQVEIKATKIAVKYNILGKVVDSTGKLLPEVSVKVGETTITTDINGVFTVGELSSGSYSVSATKEGYTIATKSVVIGDKDASVTLEAQTIPIVTPPVVGKYTAHGTLKDNAGKPLAGILVQIGDKNVTTDAAGNWKVEGLAEGDYTVKGALDNFTCLAEVGLGNEMYQQEVVCKQISSLKVSAKSTPAMAMYQGGKLSYLITATNGSDKTATGVVLNNLNLPQGVEVLGLKPLDGGECDVATVSCTLPDLAPGTSARVELELGNVVAGQFHHNIALNATGFPTDQIATWKSVKPYLSTSVACTPNPVVMLSELHCTATAELSSFAPMPTATGVKLQFTPSQGTELKAASTNHGQCEIQDGKAICSLNDLSIIDATQISKATVELDLKLVDAGLLVLTSEAKLTAANYAEHTVKSRTNIMIPKDFKADLVLAIDTTYSMNKFINGVIKGLEQFIETYMKDKDPATAPLTVLIEFKDNVRIVTPPTRDMNAVLTALRNLKVGGGGTCAEASVEAFNLGADYLADNGVISIVTNAPPYPDANVDALKQRVTDMTGKGAKVFILYEPECDVLSEVNQDANLEGVGTDSLPTTP